MQPATQDYCSKVLDGVLNLSITPDSDADAQGAEMIFIKKANTLWDWLFLLSEC